MDIWGTDKKEVSLYLNVDTIGNEGILISINDYTAVLTIVKVSTFSCLHIAVIIMYKGK